MKHVGSSKSENGSTSSSKRTLKALQFNVWLDATKVRGGLGLCADTILDSGADIVSLIEVKNLRGDFVERLKKELESKSTVEWYGKFAGNARKFGWDADTAILSRYPILDEEKIVYRTRENCVVRSILDVHNGQRLAVYSVHLEYRSYTCYLPRGYNSNSKLFPGWGMIRGPTNNRSWGCWMWEMVFGGGQQQQQPLPMINPELIRQDNIASTRPEAIQRLMDDARSLERQHNDGEQIPIIIMGDFNEPSALDWTTATANTADHNGLVYPWDSTELLRQDGYVDSYREVYPDPVKNPGYTWPAAARGTDGVRKKTSWLKMADERDRIDFIFYKKGGQGCLSCLQAKDSWLVGTPISVVRNAFVDESSSSSIVLRGLVVVVVTRGVAAAVAG